MRNGQSYEKLIHICEINSRDKRKIWNYEILSQHMLVRKGKKKHMSAYVCQNYDIKNILRQYDLICHNYDITFNVIIFTS